MPEQRESDPSERLRRAVEVYLANRDARPIECDAVIARHPELQDLLQPMFGRPSSEPRAERALGAYTLLREVGRGGMGVVHEARDERTGTVVAIKLLAAHMSSSTTAVTRFERESRLAARLEHPGIVPVIELGEHEGTRFLAMAFVEGAPLDGVLRTLRARGLAELDGEAWRDAILEHRHRRRDDDGPTPGAATAFAAGPIEIAVRIALQVAEALEHAHARGIIHRDVKPSNVLTDADGRAVLTDFGLARHTDEASLTMTGDFAGTFCYVSPEQAMAKRVEVDHRTDLFSLGVTLYELLTLQRPFDGDTPQAVLAAVVTKDPLDPALLNPRISRDLATIVLHAIEKDRDRRYASAATFAADLRAFLDSRPIAARRPSWRARAVRWARRRPLVAAVVLFVALVIPVLASAIGYLSARSAEIDIGRETIRRRQVEQALVEGFVSLHEQRPATIAAAFARALALEPASPDAVAGLLLDRILMEDWRGARRVIAEHAATVDSHPALRRLAAEVAAVLRGKPLPTDEPAADALSQFVAGLRDLSLVHSGSPSLAARAFDRLSLAVMYSPAPREHFLIYRARAASYSHDERRTRESCAALERHWPDSRFSRATIGRALGPFDPAAGVAAARAAMQLGGYDPRLTIDLAGMLGRLGDKDSAWAAAREVLERGGPDNPADACSLGLALDCIGRRPEAIDVLRRGVALNPDLAATRVHLALVLRNAGAAAEALEVLEEAVARAPNYVDALSLRGQLAAQHGDAALAVASFRSAIRLAPQEGHLRMQLAAALLAANEPAAAATAAREAAAMAPGEPGAHEVLMQALVAGRRWDELDAEADRWAVLRDDGVAWCEACVARLHKDRSRSDLDLASARRALVRALARAPDAEARTAELLADAKAAGRLPADAPPEALAEVLRSCDDPALLARMSARIWGRLRKDAPPARATSK